MFTSARQDGRVALRGQDRDALQGPILNPSPTTDPRSKGSKDGIEEIPFMLSAAAWDRFSRAKPIATAERRWVSLVLHAPTDEGPLARLPVDAAHAEVFDLEEAWMAYGGDIR